MRRSAARALAAAVAAVTASLAMSGCWFLQEVGWNPDRVEPGEVSTAKIGLMGSGQEGRSRFFLLTLFQNSGSVSYGPARFDATKVLGRRPKRMVPDPALLQELDDSGACDEFLPLGGGFPADDVRLFRTEGNVESPGRKLVQARLRTKVARSSDGGAVGGLLVVGFWRDDGDGVPEGGGTEDQLGCSGFATTGYVVKGSLGKERSLRSLLDP